MIPKHPPIPPNYVPKNLQHSRADGGAECGGLPGLVDAVPVPRVTGVEVIARTQDGGVYVPEGQQGWQPVRNGDQVVVPGG